MGNARDLLNKVTIPRSPRNHYVIYEKEVGNSSEGIEDRHEDPCTHQRPTTRSQNDPTTAPEYTPEIRHNIVPYYDPDVPEIIDRTPQQVSLNQRIPTNFARRMRNNNSGNLFEPGDSNPDNLPSRRGMNNQYPFGRPYSSGGLKLNQRLPRTDPRHNRPIIYQAKIR